jgi:O-antigen/teichoic acid export membrane protein
MTRLGETSRQTAVLYGAQLLSMALNFGFVVVLGRAMGDDYGVYSFCVFSVVVFLGFLFEFGAFSAGQRLLAVAASVEEERRVLGALSATALAIGIVFAVVVALVGPAVDALLARYHPNDAPVTGLLLGAAPLAVAIPLQTLAEFACQGANRIATLAAFRLATPIVQLGIVGLTLASGAPITPYPAIAAYLGGILLVSVGTLAAMRPSFDLGREDFARVAEAVRAFGLDIYAGRVVGMMSLRLDQVMIPFFVGTRRWGAYSIAQRVAEPISNLARSLATTRFKAFANASEVDVAVVRWNIVLLGAAASGLAGLGPFAFTIVFPNRFRNALPLFLPFALAAFFAGLLQPYNVFLTAHGAGRSLRNVALAVGAVNVVCVPAFTYRYGLGGAAWYAVGSMAFNFALHLYYYLKLRKTLELQAGQAIV